MKNRHRSLLALEGERRAQTGWWHSIWRSHLKPLWHDHQWLFIALLWALTLYLGCIGFAKNRATGGQVSSFWDIFYLTLQLFTLNSGGVHALHWELDVARFLAPFVATLTAIQAAALIFHEQIQRLFLRFLSGHAVICGLGKKGHLAAEEFRRQGYHVVIIEQNENNEAVKICREEGMTVLIGNAAEERILARSFPGKAAFLVVLTGDDGYNASIAMKARNMLKGRRKKVVNAIVHIANAELCRLMKEQELAIQYEHHFRLQFFNILDVGAHVLIEKYSPFTTVTAGEAPHLVIVGESHLGSHVAVEAMRKWKKIRADSDQRMTMTLAGPDAHNRAEILRNRHPSLEKYCDLRAAGVSPRSADFEKGRFLLDEQGKIAAKAIYICTDDEKEAMAEAMAILNRISHQDIPVIMQVSGGDGLASLSTSEGNEGILGKLVPFPLVRETCTFELLLGGSNEIIARRMHEDYVKDRKAQGLSESDRRSLASWEKLPGQVREWTRRQADHIGEKLAAVGYTITPLADIDEVHLEFSEDEIEVMVRMERERFVKERRAEGWSDGPLDPARKTSPHLGAWEDLPPDIQEYVRHSIRRIPGFLAEAGFQVKRNRHE